MGAQVKIPGRERLRHAGQTGVPLVAGPGAEPVAPGAVARRWVPVVRNGVDADRHVVRVEAERATRLDEELAHPERTGRRQREGLAALQERVALVAGRNSGGVLDVAEVGL